MPKSKLAPALALQLHCLPALQQTEVSSRPYERSGHNSSGCASRTSKSSGAKFSRQIRHTGLAPALVERSRWPLFVRSRRPKMVCSVLPPGEVDALEASGSLPAEGRLGAD